jgi:hypothetical protein
MNLKYLDTFDSSKNDPFLGWIVHNNKIPLVPLFLLLAFLLFFVTAALSLFENVFWPASNIKEAFINDFSTIADFLFLKSGNSGIFNIILQKH